MIDGKSSPNVRARFDHWAAAPWSKATSTLRPTETELCRQNSEGHSAASGPSRGYVACNRSLFSSSIEHCKFRVITCLHDALEKSVSAADGSHADCNPAWPLMLRQITIVSEVFRPSTRTTSRRRATCPFRDIQRAFALHDTCYFNSSLPIVLKRWTGSVVPSPIFVAKAVYDTRGYAINSRSGKVDRHHASRSQIMHKRSYKLDPRRCRLCNSCHRFNHGCKAKKKKKESWDTCFAYARIR